MATKVKKIPARRQAAVEPSSKPLQIIVRRGALKRFDALKKATAELPVVLTWDRRLAERRAPSADAPEERRKADRRQKPQFTWEMADFVVVEAPVESSAADTEAAESTIAAPKARKRR